jgi:hypothetical protein
MQIKSGGLCGQPEQHLKAGPICGFSTFQPASDNKCKSFGGCAVPISAYQLYPEKGKMVLYTFDKDGSDYKSKQILDERGDPAYVYFNKGDSVHHIAYQAYKTAMKVQNPEVKVPDEPPPANTLRLVFPPST